MGRPSWTSSTLSQLAVMSVGFFAIAAFMTGVATIWFKLPPDTAKQVMEPFGLLLGMFGSAYLAVRKNGNTEVKSEVKPNDNP